MKIMITALYSLEAITYPLSRVGTEKLFLIIDSNPDTKQDKALKTIKESFGKVIDIKVYKTSKFNPVKVAKITVNIIDSLKDEDKILINTSGSNKPLALGLLFGAYRRISKVDRIFYYDFIQSRFVDIPKIPFEVTDSQRKLLEIIKRGHYKSLSELAEKSEQSRAMLHRNLQELETLDLIKREGHKKYILKDGGLIAIM